MSDTIFISEIDGKLAISFGENLIVHLSAEDSLKLAGAILNQLETVKPN